MKSPFKVGDKVVCIEPHSDGRLTKGEIYEVKDIYRKDALNEYLVLSEAPGISYSPSRFKAEIPFEEEEDWEEILYEEEEEVDPKFAEFSVGDRYIFNGVECEIIQLGGGAPAVNPEDNSAQITAGKFEKSDYIWIYELLP